MRQRTDHWIVPGRGMSPLSGIEGQSISLIFPLMSLTRLGKITNFRGDHGPPLAGLLYFALPVPMPNRPYKAKPIEIRQLIPSMGGCIVSDHITHEGMTVGYMYRTAPQFEHDSGWRFFSGLEDQAYVDEASNLDIYNVNTIANYDASIIPYLHLPAGTALERAHDGAFVLIEDE
jgi:hypothetical protein